MTAFDTPSRARVCHPRMPPGSRAPLRGPFAIAALAALAVACNREQKLEAPTALDVFGTANPATPVALRLDTTAGVVHCTVDPRGAPQAAASFVGLATGRTPFRDFASGKVVKRPYYDGLPFFRVVPSVLVQSGCPRGDGTGYPGYRFPVEARPDDEARLAAPGALVLARYTPPPGRTDPDPPGAGDVHGSQFAITLGDMKHLAGTATVLGSCTDLDVVRRLVEQRRAGQVPVLRHLLVP